MSASKDHPRIVDVRAYLIAPDQRKPDASRPGSWLFYQEASTPMSKYEKYKRHRSSWGVDVLKKFVVEIETSDGTRGIGVGNGGFVGCFLTEDHFKRFLIGADPRDINLIWDQMFLGSLHYGRKGVAIMVISVIDLALWDLLGKLRGEPVYKLIGGQTKDRLTCYLTGPRPEAAKEKGFWGGKVPLPYGPTEPDGLQKNYDYLAARRKNVGPGYRIMVDCSMSLSVAYTIKLVIKCADLDTEWWEEVLSPDDTEGYVQLRQALPTTQFTTGEHEYTRYGHRKLIEGRLLDIIQPDIMWCGGLTELRRIGAHAAAYDVAVVPHATSHYSVHFCMSPPNAPIVEYMAYAADGTDTGPGNGDFFVKEPLPTHGIVKPEEFDKPGFGLEISPHVKLVPAGEVLKPYHDLFDGR